MKTKQRIEPNDEERDHVRFQPSVTGVLLVMAHPFRSSAWLFPKEHRT